MLKRTMYLYGRRNGTVLFVVEGIAIAVAVLFYSEMLCRNFFKWYGVWYAQGCGRLNATVIIGCFFILNSDVLNRYVADSICQCSCKQMDHSPLHKLILRLFYCNSGLPPLYLLSTFTKASGCQSLTNRRT